MDPFSVLNLSISFKIHFADLTFLSAWKIKYLESVDFLGSRNEQDREREQKEQDPWEMGKVFKLEDVT